MMTDLRQCQHQEVLVSLSEKSCGQTSIFSQMEINTASLPSSQYEFDGLREKLGSTCPFECYSITTEKEKF